MFYYLQIDENKKVVGFSNLSGLVEDDRLIQTDVDGGRYVGYTYDNGIFIPPEPVPEPSELPTLDEKIDLLGQMVVELYLKDGEV